MVLLRRSVSVATADELAADITTAQDDINAHGALGVHAAHGALLGEPSDQTALGFNADRTPNANRAVLVTVAVNHNVDIGETGLVELRVEDATPPTITRAPSLTVNNNISSISEQNVLAAIVPPGWTYRLVDSGTANSTIVNIFEYVIGGA